MEVLNFKLNYAFLSSLEQKKSLHTLLTMGKMSRTLETLNLSIYANWSTNNKWKEKRKYIMCLVASVTQKFWVLVAIQTKPLITSSFNPGLAEGLSYLLPTIIWVRFLRTGIGPELCDFFKKFGWLLWPNVKNNAKFFNWLWEIFFTTVLGKKYGSLWHRYTTLHYT